MSIASTNPEHFLHIAILGIKYNEGNLKSYYTIYYKTELQFSN